MILVRFRWLLIPLLISGNTALAEDANSPDPTPSGTLEATPLPPLADPNDPSLPAKELFGRKTKPFGGSDAHGSLKSSNRARRRHLVQADARSRPFSRSA